ncbi:MAG: hypothetical protein LC793_24045 [Thermomicrobia bacterium]|nr:hypothetical protein [Thermomicrobia bacterium]
MRTLTMTIEGYTDDDLALGLEAITGWINQGYESGHSMHGYWSITGDEVFDGDWDEEEEKV